MSTLDASSGQLADKVNHRSTNGDRNKRRSRSVESGEVSQSDDIKIAFDDSTAAVLLIALKEPESDLSVLKSTLNKVAYNELVRVAQSRLCDP